ncbi:MAG TPA: hypothetical protein VIX17_10685 [Pyrinomonadaceae bacterium]|jgi:hypothetical protein
MQNHIAYDSDYFLEAQRDYPESPTLEDEWIKYVSVSKIVVKGVTATLIVSFGEDGALAKALPFSDTPNQTFHLQAHNWKV